MKKTALLCLAASILLTVPCATRAAAPSYLPVQGFLTDADGTPINGATSFTFSIYDNEAGGEPLWTETLSSLVEEGVFTVYLGEVESIDMAMFRDYSDLWLGVQVAGDDEMPRVYLGSTPFSGYAEYCGNVPVHAHSYTDILSPTPDMGGNARGFSYADVNYLGNVNEAVTVNWTFHNDWDGRFCQDTDTEGNTYLDTGGTVRPWVLYEYQ